MESRKNLLSYVIVDIFDPFSWRSEGKARVGRTVFHYAQYEKFIPIRSARYRNFQE